MRINSNPIFNIYKQQLVNEIYDDEYENEYDKDKTINNEDDET